MYCMCVYMYMYMHMCAWLCVMPEIKKKTKKANKKRKSRVISLNSMKKKVTKKQWKNIKKKSYLSLFKLSNNLIEKKSLKLK
jgi:hypothetical protein